MPLHMLYGNGNSLNICFWIYFLFQYYVLTSTMYLVRTLNLFVIPYAPQTKDAIQKPLYNTSFFGLEKLVNV